MLKHHSNGLAVARHLESHPAVERAIHPLLDSHRSAGLARAQNAGMHSGMVSFFVRGGEPAASAVLANIKVSRAALSILHVL